MPDVLAFNHVDDKFRNIGGMIGNPFERLRHEGEPDRAGNGPRVFQHKGEQFSKQLLVHLIDKVVGMIDM